MLVGRQRDARVADQIVGRCGAPCRSMYEGAAQSASVFGISGWPISAGLPSRRPPVTRPAS